MRKKPSPPPVVEYEVDNARPLVTIEPDSRVWSSPAGSRMTVEAAIVRIRPPADAPDSLVQRVKEFVEKAGAIRVTVLPRPKKELLPEKRAVEVVAPRGAREAVMELVEESSSSEKQALRELCEKVMSEIGL